MELLDRGIRRLPEDLRTVLLMQVLGEMSSTEIGRLLQRPPGTVRYQLSVARRQLAKEIRLIDNDRDERMLPA